MMLPTSIKIIIAGWLGKSAIDHTSILSMSAPYRDRIYQVADGFLRHVLIGIFYKESRFNPNAVGQAGEIGIGQFMPIAARDIDVEFEDLKGNPDLQIESAARLVALNARRFDGNLFDAVRAYNVGSGNARADGSSGSLYAVDVLWIAFIDFLWSQLRLS